MAKTAVTNSLLVSHKPMGSNAYNEYNPKVTFPRYGFAVNLLPNGINSETAKTCATRHLTPTIAYLHLREFQRAAFPGSPLYMFLSRVSHVATVQVRDSTAFVPPGTMTVHCTRGSPLVVVLVSCAKVLSQMVGQCITFRQHIVYWFILYTSLHDNNRKLCNIRRLLLPAC